MLHLKSGASYIEENTMLLTGEFLQKKLFEGYKIIEVAE